MMGCIVTGSMVILDGILTVEQAPAIQSALISVVAKEDPEVILDLQAVEEMDVAIVQILYSLKVTLDHHGRRLRCAMVPISVCQTVQWLGLEFPELRAVPKGED